MNDISGITLTGEVIQTITPEQAWHYHILPKENKSGFLSFYCHEATDALQEELEMIFDKKIRLEPVDEGKIKAGLSKYYRTEKKQKGANNESTLLGSSGDFLYKLITEARLLRSSDIHIETYENKCRIRIRIDGQLVERFRLDKTTYPSFINKIKIMSNLDIAEKRLPQDGRIFFENEGLKFDIRVSVLPTLHGEKVVMRLLGNDAANIDINTLGFSGKDLAVYLEGIKKPNGILLISGPTGSGKTTTLYATLKLLNKESRNILTVEDPIEYTLEGINQVQLKENIGLTFASALRSFLRQDPDVIMVGEIRDAETANMAIRASLTGHLVLSTIHTNSAWGSIARLTDMGIPPFLVASTLNTSVAQRLVRLLCPHCKQEENFDESLFPSHFRPDRKITRHSVAKGCEKCYYTGYKGRKAIYEIIPVDNELAALVKSGNHTHIDTLLKSKGIATLPENALSLFERAETTIDEIYPIVSVV